MIHEVRCPNCDNYYGGHATGGHDICDCHMKTIADIVIEVLEGRSGFDHWWHEIEDKDIQRDIKRAINEAAKKFLGTSPGVEKTTKTENSEV